MGTRGTLRDASTPTACRLGAERSLVRIQSPRSHEGRSRHLEKDWRPGFIRKFDELEANTIADRGNDLSRVTRPSTLKVSSVNLGTPAPTLGRPQTKKAGLSGAFSYSGGPIRFSLRRTDCRARTPTGLTGHRFPFHAKGAAGPTGSISEIRGQLRSARAPSRPRLSRAEAVQLHPRPRRVTDG